VKRLRSEAKQALWLCSRQSGKSTTAAVRALHTALYKPESLILLVAMGQRQSGELFRKVLALYRQLGRPVPAEAENQLSLHLENGSRVLSLPGGGGDTLRGYSAVSELIIDEAARVEDAMLASVRPMLAVSQGRLLALSTPAGRRGWFWQAWQSGGAAWERVQVPASECPRITPDFLASERRALGEWAFEQEYELRFVESQSQAFRLRDIDRLFSEECEPWDWLSIDR
jgi:hypothetical protein